MSETTFLDLLFGVRRSATAIKRDTFDDMTQ